ncbi:MAG TPA: hypothetical protein VGL92_16825, partial [Acidimicrobiia bacterium]
MAAEAERRAGLGGRLWAHSASIRVRTTAAAVVVVGLSLVLGGLMMTSLLRRALERDVRTAA